MSVRNYLIKSTVQDVGCVTVKSDYARNST
ncbi:MAG TPA: hypothetical protein [Bacteriophage sp.]|nr:MAG TPA: hypothetical protein [Bacteriophage sp.]